MIVSHRRPAHVCGMVFFLDMPDIQRKLSLCISHVSVLMLALKGCLAGTFAFQVSLPSFPSWRPPSGCRGDVTHEPPHVWIGFRGNLNRL